MTKKPILIPFLALAACHDPAPVAAPTARTSTSTSTSAAARDSRLDVLERMRAAIERKDARAVAALYTDDAVVEVAGGRTLRGRADIEANERAGMAPAEVIQLGIARVWLVDDVAIAELVFRAHHGVASPLGDVGASTLEILWFDRDGKIKRAHEYRDQPTLDQQAANDPRAAEVPSLPTATEIHVARADADNRAMVEWTRDVEQKDEADASFNDERLQFECVAGHAHASSRAELDAMMQPWRKAFPGYKNVVGRIWVVDDYVIVEDTFTGRHTGDLGKTKATDKQVAWHWAHVWKVDNKKITRAWQWGNFDELYQQLGIEPERSALKGHAACSVAS